MDIKYSHSIKHQRVFVNHAEITLTRWQEQARIQDFLKGGGVMATRGGGDGHKGGGVIGGDRPCRRKITI